MFTVKIFFVVLALVLTFYIGVWRGVNNTPMWMLYISMAIMAIGGGAAINLILSRA